MQLIKRQERIGEICFYIGITIQLLLMTIGYGKWDVPFHGRFMQLAFVLFCIKIVTTKYSKAEWIAMLLLGGLGAVSYLVIRDEYVVSVVVMIFAAKNIDMYRVCKGMLIVAFIFTVSFIILSLLGIGDEPVNIRDYGRGAIEARWSLGLGHANTLHGTVWYLVSLFVILYYESLKWQHYLLLTIGNMVLFSLTASRGGLIVVQIILVAAFVLKYFPRVGEKKFLYILGMLEIIGVVTLSITSAVIEPENTPIISRLDTMLTGRLHLIQWSMDISQWRWIDTNGNTAIADVGWALIFYRYGYIVGAVFTVVHLYLMHRVWKEKNGILLAVLVTSAFFIFMEATYMLNSSYLLCNISYVVAMILLNKPSGVYRNKEIDN